MHVLARTVARTCKDGCTYLQGRMHVLAGKVASTNVENAGHCEDGCSALQRRLQCTASEMGKTGIVIASPVLDKRKGRKDSLHIRVSVAAPRKFLLSRYGP